MMSRFLSPVRPAARGVAGLDPMSDLQREMSRLMDDFLGAGTALSPSLSMAVPRIDMRENLQEICVSAELPGVKPESVDIRLEGNLLTIRGEKRQEVQQEKEDYYLMECSYGRFQRSIQLPYRVDPSHVRAEFDNGVLTLHVPKEAQQERSQRITIQAHEGGAQPTTVKATEPATPAQPH
jgi:HSP20 family protein